MPNCPPVSYEKCTAEEITLIEAKAITLNDLQERMFVLLQCESGIREANEKPTDELLFLREAILSEMLELEAKRTEIGDFLVLVASSRIALKKSENIKTQLRMQEYLHKNAGAAYSKKSDRIARASIVRAAITRSQEQTVLVDADMERLGEKVAELFPTHCAHDGVRSNWGLRIKAGKSSGS